jgi:serine/threonine protein phosphatase PrpC
MKIRIDADQSESGTEGGESPTLSIRTSSSSLLQERKQEDGEEVITLGTERARMETLSTVAHGASPDGLFPGVVVAPQTAGTGWEGQNGSMTSRSPSRCFLERLVLKYTTLGPQGSKPQTCVVVPRKGASFGRGEGNDVVLSTDQSLMLHSHAQIFYRPSPDEEKALSKGEGSVERSEVPQESKLDSSEAGEGGEEVAAVNEPPAPAGSTGEPTSFYLQAGEQPPNSTVAPFRVAVRVGVSRGLTRGRHWPLVEGCRFSIGTSVVVCAKASARGDGQGIRGRRRSFSQGSEGSNSGEGLPRSLLLKFRVGPLAGESRVVREDGATLGRASDNTIVIQDKELSRRHSRIEYDESLEAFFLCDIGSLNGTYMQLVGLYSGPRELCIGDHILIGRTGFSVNRYDFGICERRGTRPTMEDKSIVVQGLGAVGLPGRFLSPQTFAAVYDGHGGNEASGFLAKTLHQELRSSLEQRSTALCKAASNLEVGGFATGADDTQATRYALLDLYVKQAMKEAFRATDEAFIKGSINPHAGSTATTALIMGNRLYSANVGDSRTIICRRGEVFLTSDDHTPQRADEVERIKNAGGFVVHRRVMGELAVSRAFGDTEYKRRMAGSAARASNVTLVTADPEFAIVQLTPDDDFVALACDGIFDVYTNAEIVEAIKEQMDAHGDSQRTVEVITEHAISERHTRDNVTLVLLVLRPWVRRESHFTQRHRK